MAAPACAGGAALVRQYFARGYHITGVRNDAAGINASASLIKAMIINTAKPMKYQSTVCMRVCVCICVYVYVYVCVINTCDQGHDDK